MLSQIIYTDPNTIYYYRFIDYKEMKQEKLKVENEEVLEAYGELTCNTNKREPDAESKKEIDENNNIIL
jgi:hypothetical protein